MSSPRATRPSPELASRELDGRLTLACGLAWGAGLIHIEAAIAHRRESLLYTCLFAALAVAQFAWGAAVYRGARRRVLVAGAVVSLGVVCIWLASRTIGLPIAPPDDRVESVGPIDSLATSDEIALVVLVGLHLGRRSIPVLERAVAGAAIFLILCSSLSIVVAGHAH
jgi:hypothetical protein